MVLRLDFLVRAFLLWDHTCLPYAAEEMEHSEDAQIVVDHAELIIDSAKGGE